MRAEFKDRDGLSIILPFVDDKLLRSLIWIKRIGSTMDGIPVILLNLPEVLHCDTDDITDEFAQFVKFLSLYPKGYCLFVVADDLGFLKFGDFGFFKQILDYIAESIRSALRTVWVWNACFRFKAFIKYYQSFSSSASGYIVNIKTEKDVRKLINVNGLNIVISDDRRVFLKADLEDITLLHSPRNAEESDSIGPFRGSQELASLSSSSSRESRMRSSRKGVRISSPLLLSNPISGESSTWMMPSLELQCKTSSVSPFLRQILPYIATHGLDVEGIFRKNGDEAVIRAFLRETMYSGEMEQYIEKNRVSIIDVVAALKTYLHEVQLIPVFLYPYIESISAMTDEEEIRTTIEMILQLVDGNRLHCLAAVVGLLVKVVENAEKNQMNLKNLLTCVNLNLMPNAPGDKENPFAFGKRLRFLSSLIKEHDHFFEGITV